MDKVSALLQIEGINQNDNITIMDMNGKIMISKQVFSNESISLRQLPASVYLLRITGDKTNFIQKIIKE